jgi:hypothetical protein
MVLMQQIKCFFYLFSQVPTVKLGGLLFLVFLGLVILGALSANYTFTDFNMPAVSDWGCTSNTQKNVNNINFKGLERVLALGDYFYQDTATCWLNLVLDFDARTRIAIGNHEEEDSEGYQTYKSHFRLGNPYYSFN